MSCSCENGQNQSFTIGLTITPNGVSAGSNPSNPSSTNTDANGRLIVNTLEERNSIPVEQRKEGLVVYVKSVKRAYTLKDRFPTTTDMEDSDWEEVAPFAAPNVEDIAFGEPTPDGSTTLSGKLNQLDDRIDEIDAKGIEDFTWNELPDDGYEHQENLGDELKSIAANMNNPAKIIVSNSDGTTGNLQAKLNELEHQVPFVEDITDKEGNTLKDLLANSADPTKITVDTDEEGNPVSLTDKLADIDSTLADQNDADKIMVKTSGGNGLNMSLNDRLGLMDTTLADQNDATKIEITNNDGTVGNLQAKMNSIDNVLADQNDPAKIPISDEENLADRLAVINNTLADQNDPNKIIVGQNDEGNVESLTDRLIDIDNTLADQNDATKIEITNNDGTVGNLQAKMDSIDNTLANQNDPNKIIVGQNEQGEDVSLADKIADQNDANKIIVGEPGVNNNVSLNAKCASIDSKFAELDTTLEDQNDPDKIIVGKDAEDNDINLTNALTAIDNTLADQNDATKIEITNNDGTVGNLQAKMDSIDNILADQNDPTKIAVAKTDEGEDVSLADKLNELDNILADQNDPNKIFLGDTEAISLTDKMAAVDNKLADQNDADKIMVHTSGEQYGLNIPLNERLGILDNILADQNDPTKIVVGQDAEQNDINLADKLAAIDTKLADQNDATKIEITNNDGTVGNLQAKMDSIDNVLADQNDPTKIAVAKTDEGEDISLADKLAAVDTTLADQNDPNKIFLGDTEAISLTDKMAAVDNKLADQNDPTKIVVGKDAEDKDVSLVNKLEEIDKAIENAGTKSADGIVWTNGDQEKSVADALTSINTDIGELKTDINTLPHYLLFSIVKFVKGALKTQEYLTTFDCIIKEITVYSNADATLDGSITVAVESAPYGETTYTAIGTGYTLAPEDEAKIHVYDLGAGIKVNKNTRIRINLTDAFVGNVLEVFNVRVQLSKQ